jgi:hypothetical protein
MATEKPAYSPSVAFQKEQYVVGWKQKMNGIHMQSSQKMKQGCSYVDVFLYKCFLQKHSERVPTHRALLKAQVLQFSKLLGGNKTFKSSEELLWRWKVQHGICKLTFKMTLHLVTAPSFLTCTAVLKQWPVGSAQVWYSTAGYDTCHLHSDSLTSAAQSSEILTLLSIHTLLLWTQYKPCSNCTITFFISH